jgi:lipopolysaccharide export system permease protein
MILDRYIAKTLLNSTLTVTTVLMAIFTFILFTDELGKVGRGAYTAVVATQYIVAIMPRLFYQIFPAAVLIGTLLGLGTLASSAELTAMRAAGVSLRQLVRSVLKVGAIFVGVSLVVGEAIAPYTETFAETTRTLAMNEGKALRTSHGLWVREGSHFIRLNQSGGQIGQVDIYEVDANHQLSHVTKAKEAIYRGNDQWLLLNVRELDFTGDTVRQRDVPQIEWRSLLSPDLLNVVTINPESMSAIALYRYADYLQNNNIDAQRYVQAFWAKVITPFSVVVMVLLAIPFILGPLRNMAAGHRILIGTLAGVGFHILSQISGYVGLVYGFNPILAAIAPTAMFFAVALLLFRSVH